MKLSLLSLASLLLLLSSGTVRADVVSNCDAMKYAQTTLDIRDIEKCRDIQAQKGPLFQGEGRAIDIGACFSASSKSESSGLNSCREYAVKNGMNARGCKQIANFKIADGYQCTYNSLYYLKDSESAFIAFTLDRTTQIRLFEEAQKRSISVRELIAEKLQK